MKDKIEETKKYFAFYGFLKCPLSENEIKKYLNNGYSKSQIYLIGCDIYNGCEGDK